MTLPLLTIQAFEDRNFKPLFLKNVKVSRSRNIEVISLARQGKARQGKAKQSAHTFNPSAKSPASTNCACLTVRRWRSSKPPKHTRLGNYSRSIRHTPRTNKHWQTTCGSNEMEKAVRICSRTTSNELLLRSPGGPKKYDTASEGVRCRPVHLEWISRLQCPVVNLDSSAAPQVLAEEVIRAIA